MISRRTEILIKVLSAEEQKYSLKYYQQNNRNTHESIISRIIVKLIKVLSAEEQKYSLKYYQQNNRNTH